MISNTPSLHSVSSTTGDHSVNSGSHHTNGILKRNSALEFISPDEEGSEDQSEGMVYQDIDQSVGADPEFLFHHSLSHSNGVSIAGQAHSMERASSNSNPANRALNVMEVVKCARRLGECTRCFSLNHKCFDCKTSIRCAICFNYEHKSRFCLTKS